MFSPIFRAAVSILATGLLITGCAEVLSNLPLGDPMNGSTPEDGLREALSVGTGRAVDTLGKEGGYWGRAEVRIPLPEKLARLGEALRFVGAGRTVDRFEESMNRAAEAAAPLARQIFVNAILQMSFSDAMTILQGKGHEATDYLRKQAGPELTEAFQPMVADKLDSVGVTQQFRKLMDEAAKVPFIRVPRIDLNQYVTTEAIEGLFLMIGREEERIRQDPLARTTELLRKWFGRAAGKSASAAGV